MKTYELDRRHASELDRVTCRPLTLVQLIGQRLSILSGHLALLCEIYFVSHDDDRDGVAPDLPRLLHPTLHIFEALPARDVVADYGHLRVIDVRGY